MSDVRGVVIQPSAWAAIQATVFGPASAPMTSGMCGWTGRFPAGAWWSASSSVFHPNPAPMVTRPPERWSIVAMVFARVIGSNSTGSATEVPRRIVDVTAAAVARATHGSSAENGPDGWMTPCRWT